jgi:hypothetical protein
MANGGVRIDVYRDFALPGGMKIMSRLISPERTRSSAEISLWWCAAGK